MQSEPVPLSDALRTFIKHDNRLFKQEILDETPPRDRKRASSVGHGEGGGEGGLPAASPPKRHQREGSIDSIATNRASMGDISDRGDFADDDMVGTGDAAYAMQAAVARQHAVEDEGFHEQESDGGVGTEMVQLAISQPLGGDGAQSQAAAVETRTDGYIADWDHPEGKPVRVQSPRAHFYE